MEYVYLMIVSIMFSFGGLLIKLSGGMFSPYMITFLRFAIGIVILAAIQKRQSGHVRLCLSLPLVWWGAVCKLVHYLGENYGVVHGFSYGGVVVWPVQTLTVLAVSVLLLHEALGARKTGGSLLCILGIFLISWNGASPEVFAGARLKLLLIFAAAGIGAALFSVAQKRLLGQMDTVTMNFSMFFVGTLGSGALLPARPASELVSGFHSGGLLCALALGAITGLGFLLIAEAMKKVPLVLVTVIQSSTVILTLVWGVIFFHEPMSLCIVGGTVIFIIGMLMINLHGSALRRLLKGSVLLRR